MLFDCLMFCLVLSMSSNIITGQIVMLENMKSYLYPGNIWAPLIYKTVGFPIQTLLECAGFCAMESPNCTVVVFQGNFCHLGNAGGPYTLLGPQTDIQPAFKDLASNTFIKPLN